MDKKVKRLWMFLSGKTKASHCDEVSDDCRQPLQQQGSPEASISPSCFAIAKAALFSSRRLQITPNKHLYFLRIPNEQVASALKVKNTSHSFVAFKLQTNSPKGCLIRPPVGVLTPGETVICSVLKFIEPSEHKRAKIIEKFKVVSLKVKKGVQYSLELFEEQKESVTVEGSLEVVYLDPESRSPEIEKLNERLAEAKAFQQRVREARDSNSQKILPVEGNDGDLQSL